MIDETARRAMREDADMLRSTSRNGETSMNRVEAFERLFKQLPELVDELERLRDDRGSIALEIERQEASTEQDVHDALADATGVDSQVDAVMPFLETAWKCSDRMFRRAEQAETAVEAVRAWHRPMPVYDGGPVCISDGACIHGEDYPDGHEASNGGFCPHTSLAAVICFACSYQDTEGEGGVWPRWGWVLHANCATIARLDVPATPPAGHHETGDTP